MDPKSLKASYMDLEIEGVSKEELQNISTKSHFVIFLTRREEVALHTRMVHEFLTKTDNCSIIN